MAVALDDLIDSLKREISPPGTNLFPNATDDELLGNLSDAFWEMVLDGLVTGYESDGDFITPVSGTTDLGRDMQQLIVFYAGVRIVRNEIRGRNTVFRTKAGPVEYETQQSANVLRDLLAELVRRRDFILYRLSDAGAVGEGYIDMLAARTDSIIYGDTSFPSSRQGGVYIP